MEDQILEALLDELAVEKLTHNHKVAEIKARIRNHLLTQK